MPHAQIKNGIWYRLINDTWENADGWRTDIAQSVLDDLSVTKALFILEETKGVFVSMDDLRKVLSNAPRRNNGMVGPFNVNPHTLTINGIAVPMEIKFRKMDAV
jgi:hypothetical protein